MNAPQWDEQRKSWVIWDHESQRWLQMAIVRRSNGIKDALAVWGGIALVIGVLRIAAWFAMQ